MKLIIAIIRDEYSDGILQSLVKEEFRVTRIASTGGFLRRGQTTLMIGVEDEKVDQAISVVEDQCAPNSDPGARCATLFVLNVEHFSQV
jgi:uncharacterized protein YaaQ